MNGVACRITKHTVAIQAFELKPDKKNRWTLFHHFISSEALSGAGFLTSVKEQARTGKVELN